MMFFKKVLKKDFAHSPFDRLHHSERQLNEFLRLENRLKITSYETLLKPAITKIYAILSSISENHYPNMDNLASDYIFVDVGIIPYYDKDGSLSYISLHKAQTLKYPSKAYTIEDAKMGICLKENGLSFYNARVAIEWALTQMAKKWIAEIPSIRKEIEEFTKEDSD